MNNYSDFGIQARTIMLQKKLTLTALARKIGITCSYLSDILKGSREGRKHKKQIAEILDMKDWDC